MKNVSIWEDTVNLKSYDELNEDKNVDILIIGGGITGINTLYRLKDLNKKIMLVEQNKIGKAVTSKSTGKLTYLQNDLIDKIRKKQSDKVALEYIKSQQEAIKITVDIIKKEKINCNLTKVDSYVYTNKKSEEEKLKELKKFLEENKINVKEAKNNIVKSKYMIKVEDTYIFHPLKYIKGLLEVIKNPIYENTRIKKITKEGNYYICETDKYKIKTKWVVLASHYPYFTIPYLFPIKSSLEKSYISASKSKEKKQSLISYSNPFISIRTYEDYLIYLSNSHSIEKNIDDEKNYKELKKKIKNLKLTPDYMWSNIDIITTDGMPYIGKIKQNIIMATGYNTWGLATSTLAAEIIKNIITNEKNQYETIFDPYRINKKIVIEIMLNIIKNVKSYVKSYIIKDHKIVSYKENNKKIIAPKKCKEQKVEGKCTHLKCKLRLNENDNTWDCQCHGSRFDISGKVISGPANKDITI